MSSSGPQERPAEGTARSAVLWGGLALLSVLALAGWWATRTVRLPREFREPEDPEAQDLAEPLPGPTPAVEAAPLGSGVDPAAHGRDEPGVVIVRVQDAESGEPLAGIEVEVGCEEPVRRSFGRRVTSSDGSARFPGVSVPVALAATRRSERYCAALTVARGGLDGARVATLRLVPGGALRGRVVDDRGLPVADAALSLTDPTPWPEPVLDPRPVARSRADGSFEIERVRDQPRLVTTRQGSFFAAAWAPVQVQARGLGGTAQGVVSVAPCGEARIADLVLPRPPTFVGRVFDFDGRPVAGALVSGHPRRFLARDVNLHVAAPDRVADGLADLPGSPLFQLLEGEVLTGPDGAFELTAAPSRAVLLVAPGGALRGTVREFPLRRLFLGRATGGHRAAPGRWGGVPRAAVRRSGPARAGPGTQPGGGASRGRSSSRDDLRPRPGALRTALRPGDRRVGPVPCSPPGPGPGGSRVGAHGPARRPGRLRLRDSRPIGVPRTADDPGTGLRARGLGMQGPPET
ncbi:MAG: hypothetical protein IPK67_14260 [Planctomycetes bacterium]|nr:hypothetical protein [Planctomycetota bacterium]